MSTDDEASWLDRDKEENPGCSYSSSSSKTCTSSNGKFVCETIRHITRHCPGKQPVRAYYSKNVDNDASIEGARSGVEAFGFGDIEGFGSNFGVFGNILNQIPSLFPGIRFDNDTDISVPPPPPVPPHKWNSANPPSDLKSRVSGPIEKI